MKAPKPTHYENFPVASWLCPAHLRPPIYAIYAFARLADDIADEGNAAAEQRLADLESMRGLLINGPGSDNGHSIEHRDGRGESMAPWSHVFVPLHEAITNFDLPIQLLLDLLDAFSQDIAKTQEKTTYADQAELYDYCRRSANPVGRLLLHLYGIDNKDALRMSDQICTALQLINFWQDLSRDLPNGRHYLTDADCKQYSVNRSDLHLEKQTQNLTQLVAHLVQQARQLMLGGLPLCKIIPGRAGWELRFVVQGGLRILEKIEQLHFQTLHNRPSIGKGDITVMTWRSLWM